MILKWVLRIRFTGKLSGLESQLHIFPRGRASGRDETVNRKALRQGVPRVLEAGVAKVG